MSNINPSLMQRLDLSIYYTEASFLYGINICYITICIAYRSFDFLHCFFLERVVVDFAQVYLGPNSHRNQFLN
jgi:hypothetical protein